MNNTFEMINKLDAFLENANIAYELKVLQEEAGTESEQDKASKEALSDKIIKGWRAFWDKIIDWINGIIEKITVRIRGGYKNAVLKEDITINTFAYNKTIPSGFISKICSGSIGIDDARNQIDIFRNNKIKLLRGKQMDLGKLFSTLKLLRNNSRELRNCMTSKVSAAARTVMEEFRKFIKNVMNDVKSLISATVSTEKFDKENMKVKKKERDKYLSDNGMLPPASNESISEMFDMPRNELIASIMLEAADLLKSDLTGINVSRNTTMPNPARQALQEAIDLLYDKAVLCEDSEEASAYVEKAEELQKAIEDIPEEVPVKQDEYETSVVGGDDQKPELEEIKDLCDNDPEVVKLLTDDEDKSVTVDATSNESALGLFDFDF